jgi:hypothetical protein
MRKNSRVAKTNDSMASRIFVKRSSIFYGTETIASVPEPCVLTNQ